MEDGSSNHPRMTAGAMGLLTRLMNGRVEEKESGQKRGATNPFSSQSRPEDADSRPDASLTPREVDVLRRLILGRTNQQIAETSPSASAPSSGTYAISGRNWRPATACRRPCGL
jgi:ATP/maltotriose-dependent transcriptional regulator MalT